MLEIEQITSYLHDGPFWRTESAELDPLHGLNLFSEFTLQHAQEVLPRLYLANIKKYDFFEMDVSGCCYDEAFARFKIFAYKFL